MFMFGLTTHRHSVEMIKKLRTAGLGFYVKERDTQQKLGTLHVYYLFSTTYALLFSKKARYPCENWYIE